MADRLGGIEGISGVNMSLVKIDVNTHRNETYQFV